MGGAEAVSAKKKADEAARAYRIMEAELGEQKKIVSLADAQARAQELIAKRKEEEARVSTIVGGILDTEKTDLEQIEDQIKSISQIKSLSGKEEEDRLKALSILEGQKFKIQEEASLSLREGERANTDFIKAEAGERARALAEQEQARLAVLVSFAETSKSTTKIELENIEKKRKAFIDAGVDEVAANKWAQSQILKTQMAAFKTGLSYAGNFFAQLASLYQQDMANRTAHIDAALTKALMALDAEFQAKLKEAGLADETELESLRKQLDAAIAAGDEETANELKKKIKKAELEEEYEQKKLALEKKAAWDKYKIEKSAFETNQKMSYAQAIISAAQAIVQCFADLGPIAGAIAASIVGGLTAYQLSVISNQEPPAPPALAKGAKVSSPTLAWVGDNPRYDEVVAPLSPEVFGGIADGIVNALASRARPSGVTPATAGVESLSASRVSGGQTILQVGTLIADDAGKRWLSRTLRKYDVQESKRVG